MSRLFDDMDKQQFVYHHHFDSYIDRVYENNAENSLKRMNRLWPTAYKDIYLSEKKIGSFTVDTSTGEIIREPMLPTPLEGTLRTGQKERIRATADGRKKSHMGSEFVERIKNGGYEKEFKKWETNAGTALGAAFAKWSWKRLAGIGAGAATAGLAVGMYSGRTVNNDDEDRRR
ncbi:MAG: hypothetical protein HZT40_04260 [Candidatus Thiothrix singaporensis]|uniref:Uncharacterized protein n=1 Tax=Candidatus Thiothrix singaporensis TaxID=2799669 RepID=A0A7L6APD1_9GAMM|nr:MAG: hypothetical protein HZT40_04260 [Candidatus Thiothrix singaporensis]